MSRRKGERTSRHNEHDAAAVVEIPVPEMGFGMTLDHMSDWHKAHGIPPQRGHHIRRQDRDFARWCFTQRADALAFQAEFGGDITDPMHAKRI